MSDTEPTVEIDLSQFKAALWADERQKVDAVLLGLRMVDLPGRLVAAHSAGEIDDFDCLLPGALSQEVRRDAPYLVRLRRDSTFTDALLAASEASHDWGVLVLSGVRLIELRNHLRALLQVRLPDGCIVSMDTLNPETLRVVLDHADIAQRSTVNGPVGAWVLPGPLHWAMARVFGGHLQWRRMRLTSAGGQK